MSAYDQNRELGDELVEICRESEPRTRVLALSSTRACEGAVVAFAARCGRPDIVDAYRALQEALRAGAAHAAARIRLEDAMPDADDYYIPPVFLAHHPILCAAAAYDARFARTPVSRAKSLREMLTSVDNLLDAIAGHDLEIGVAGPAEELAIASHRVWSSEAARRQHLRAWLMSAEKPDVPPIHSLSEPTRSAIAEHADTIVKRDY